MKAKDCYCYKDGDCTFYTETITCDGDCKDAYNCPLQEIRIDMSQLCDKVDHLCKSNDNCGGCLLNENSEESTEMFAIIKKYILEHNK